MDKSLSARRVVCLLVFVLCYSQTISGKQIWYNSTGTTSWERDALFLGNGKLGASFFGGIKTDSLVMNIDSLWTGGPFANVVGFRHGHTI